MCAYTQPSGREASRLIHLKQSVQLMGAGSPTFQSSMESLVDIQLLFAGHFPAGNIDYVTPTAFLDFVKIEASTRYFSSRDQDSLSESVPFSEHVDPKGILSAATGNTLFHGEDNDVKYCKILTDAEGNES